MADFTSFSRQVKDELYEVSVLDTDNMQLNLLASLFAAGRLRTNLIQISTSHRGFADLTTTWFSKVYDTEAESLTGRELTSVSVSKRETYRQISQDLRDLFSYDPVLNNLGEIPKMTIPQGQAIIRSMFLACGSIGDPRQAYHLEFALRRQPAAVWLDELLKEFEIKSHLLKRQGYSVLYVKDGKQIAELLLQCGAHIALLDFESLRVEKEMRNSVNRVVNCDSANSQRIANASARQLELIRQLEERNGFGFLPDDLLNAAKARLTNPDYSLKELGEIMIPPLGKSGMNHRLKRLERIASELLGKLTEENT